jgi:catechol 2,3-dioxygenase-like lactoylglutathione lyase family enzyme
MWFNHLHIGVRDLDRAIAFYRHTLGLEVRPIPGANWAPVRIGPNLSLDLDHDPELVTVEPKAVIIGFVVESADDTYAQLKGKGIALEGEPQDQYWGVRNFYLRDPDGYKIEVAQPLVRASGQGI